MNMRDMCHEYIGGCILEDTLLAIFLGVDLPYLFAFPCLKLIWGQGIVQRHQCYDLTCEDALKIYHPNLNCFIGKIYRTYICKWRVV